MPTAKKKTGSTTKAKQSSKPAKKKAAPTAPTLDWAATIKKAAEGKKSQPNWPGSGDAWKKKVR